MNYVSFSLFGTDPKYYVGASRNAEQVNQFYPGFVPVFYIGPDVPESCTKSLEGIGAKLIYIGDDINKIPNGRIWRALAIEIPQADIVLSRDVDSRISDREVRAVRQWMESDRLFHVMRDYSGHGDFIMAGMWGWKKELGPLGMRDEVVEWYRGDPSRAKPIGVQRFLGERIWPKVKHSVMQHDTFFRDQHPGAIPFPDGDKSESGLFVGEIIDEKGRPQKYVRQARAAMKRVEALTKEMNAGILVAVFGYGPSVVSEPPFVKPEGDAERIRMLLPYYEHHYCPVVIMSPEDAPIKKMGPHICRHAGRRAYIGQASLDRQRDHLRMLLEYPHKYFLLNDSDSLCVDPIIPPWLYDDENKGVFWSNEIVESRPHTSPYPKIALHPPYFLSRQTLQQILSVSDKTKAHPITPYIDHYMLQLVCESGVKHKSFLDRLEDRRIMLHPVKTKEDILICQCRT